MSLLNLTNDGLPNLLVTLHASVIRSSEPPKKDDLIQTVAPPDVVEDGATLARATLARWSALGLFEEVGGVIQTAKPERHGKMSALELRDYTRRCACAAVFAERNNMDLWANEAARSADLTRSLSWMLAQDVYRSRFGEFAAQETRQIRNPDKLLLVNQTRVTGLRTWTGFLGFSREPFADIDPTVAVRDALPEILDAGQGMLATTFVERLCALLPVLDRGRYQTEVLSEVDPMALPPRAPGQLSTALSRALLNLRASGKLVLDRKDDAGSAVTLTGAQGVRTDLTFQWIQRPMGAAVR
ncbi:MAG: protein DpdG [Burkholderiaceae bacterium]|nr:protein DpdG [Burkholderiaceae bacterium]